MKMTSLIKLRSATLIAGTALLLGGCGDQGGNAAANSSNSLPTVSVNEFTIGNDASAMEVVNSNTAEGPNILPMGNMSGAPDGNTSTGNGMAPAGDQTGAPGGDSGGNTVQSNVSGT